MKKPRHLGRQSRGPVDRLDLIPWTGGHAHVTLRATELTSHCPVTGQPDFGMLNVTYVPGKNLVETKSFKLYLWSFRDKAVFNERLVARIADDFMRQVRPLGLKVEGIFNLRGGIGVTCVAERDGR